MELSSDYAGRTSFPGHQNRPLHNRLAGRVSGYGAYGRLHSSRPNRNAGSHRYTFTHAYASPQPDAGAIDPYP